MSNEMKDWINDKTAQAKWLVSKYPFLRIKDNSVCPWLNTEKVEGTWLDDLPDGWVNALCIEMCDELLAALGKYVDDFIIVQTKEKYGSLVVHYHWGDKERTDEEQKELNNVSNAVHDILNKYLHRSYHTCARCGQEATKYSKPWILPFCSECFEEWKSNR